MANIVTFLLRQKLRDISQEEWYSRDNVEATIFLIRLLLSNDIPRQQKKLIFLLKNEILRGDSKNHFQKK